MKPMWPYDPPTDVVDEDDDNDEVIYSYNIWIDLAYSIAIVAAVAVVVHLLHRM